MKPTAADVKQTIRIGELVPDLRRSGAYLIGPCPRCGGRDRFNVKPTDAGDLWICRQCSPEKYGDAIDFLMWRDGRTFAQVMADYSHTGDVGAPTSPVGRPPSEEWQLVALAALGRCIDALWEDSAAGRAALAYLTGKRPKSGDFPGDRCLLPETVRSAALGYNHRPQTLQNGSTLPRGLTIPCMVDGALWYVKVRRPWRDMAAEASRHAGKVQKFKQLSGGKRALFGADQLIGARAVIVAEGEFDALLLRQYATDDVAVVTMGGAGNLPDAGWLRYFAAVDDIILLLDNDETGRAALDRWRRLLPRARVAQLPDGSKDATDWRRDRRGNLVDWVYRTTIAN